MASPASDGAGRLTLVVDRRTFPDAHGRAVHAAVSGGVDRVQLRERELEGGDWLAWAEELRGAGRSAELYELLLVTHRRWPRDLTVGSNALIDRQTLVGQRW